MEASLQKIIEGIGNDSGIDFLNNITLQLNQSIEADYTFIARLDRPRYVAKTIAIVKQGKDLQNFEYSLSGTPCANVIDDSICSYPANVTDLFPSDQLLIDMKIEGYLGTPLKDSKGNVFGLIVALYEKPIVKKDSVSSLFEIFAGRIASEIERMEYEQYIQILNDDLEEKIKQRTMALKEAQTQLIETEKLAALGSLVAGIAHEVNTPLGVSITASTHLSDALSYFSRAFSKKQLDTDDVSQFIAQAEKACQLLNSNLGRAQSLIDNFKKTAADQSHFELEDINVKQYYLQICSTLSPILKAKKVQLEVLGDDLGRLKTIPGAHAQILTNLVSNSVNHGFSSSTSNLIKIQISYIEGGVKIQYCDNGKGFRGDNKKIFEPFYTTAREKGNTGLGMSIIHNLVQQLKGSITLIAAENGFSVEYSLFNLE